MPHTFARFGRHATRITVTISLVIAIAAGAIDPLSMTPVQTAVATGEAGPISGVVFHDYNADGVMNLAASETSPQVDRPVTGVVINAFDLLGVLAGTATSDPNGVYSLNTTGAGPYRIEFSNLPQGFVFGKRATSSNASGSGARPNVAGSSVQFVAAAPAVNINLALIKPAEYCQANPILVTTCFGQGDATTGDHVAAIGFPADAGSSDLSPTVNDRYDEPRDRAFEIPNAQIGATYGIAYQRNTRQVYIGAVYKRHAGFGPNGPGAIYRTTLDAKGNAGPATLFLDLDASAGPSLHGPDYRSDWKVEGTLNSWDAAGKTSFGDIDISDDNRTLYVVNLFDRKIYFVDTDSAAVKATVEMPLNMPGAAQGCAPDWVRPFGLGVKDGLIYAGLVCTGPTPDALRAYVYRYDGVAFGAAPVVEYSLNFPRGCADKIGCPLGMINDWRPWTSTFKVASRPSRVFTAEGADAPASEVAGWAQPILSDIVFDNDGSMILGFRDRSGDQIGFNAFSNPDLPKQRYLGTAEGDLQRACLIAPDRWAAPGSAECPNKLQNGQGPGGGEYYFDDAYGDSHQEILLGGLVQLPGYDSVHSTAMDPATMQGAINSGGVRVLSNQTGTAMRAFRIYQSETLPAGFVFEGTMSKANGLGDLEALCNAAPLEIGNRVWLDSNGNGVQDPGEAGIAGVTVRLYRPGAGADGLPGTADDAASVARAVTDANGEYYFISGEADAVIDHIGVVTAGVLANTAYEIRIDNPGDRDADEPLNGMVLTERDDGMPSPSGSDVNDSDGANIANPAGSPAGAWPVIALTTGGPGVSNHTHDFGFHPSVAVGNQVWFDLNNNGKVDSDEAGAAGVRLDLFFDANGDAVLNAAEQTPLASTTTISNGFYLFNKDSTGNALRAGTYFVGVAPSNFDAGGVLSGAHSSLTAMSLAGTLTETVPPDPNTDADNDDNGAKQTGAFYRRGVLSGPISIAFNEPLNERSANAPDAPIGSTPGIVDSAPNIASNLTVDFGFYRMALGNRVWYDLDNNGVRNGVEDAPNGVCTQLYSGDGSTEIAVGADGVLGTADDRPGCVNTNSRDGNGTYGFFGLPSGDYVVCLTPPQGYGSTTGADGIYEPAPDPDGEGAIALNINGDDNGTLQAAGACAGRIASKPVTLDAGDEPNQREPYVRALGLTANDTIDFGLIPIIDTNKFSLGNRVWFDIGAGSNANNGVINVDERGAPGLTVTLYLNGPTPTPLATTRTDLFGYYRFDNLNAGSYIVEVARPAGYTPPTAGRETNPNLNVDNNHNCTVAVGTTAVRTNPITLGPNADEPVNESDTGAGGQGTVDARANMTVDCGFVIPLHSIGNQIWNDVNNNGRFEPGAPNREEGIADVILNLFYDLNLDGVIDDAELATPYRSQTSQDGGYYLFEHIPPGVYVVAVDPKNYVSGPLVGYLTSSGANGTTAGPFEPAADPDLGTQTDMRDNGTHVVADNGGRFVRSLPVTISTGQEPVRIGASGNGVAGDGLQDPIEDPAYDNDPNTPDANENLTIDFGMYKPYAVGNRVWFDANDNGMRDTDEAGIPGVQMRLYLGTTLVATTTSNSNGYYVFDALVAGNYTIEARTPAGMINSTDIATSAAPNSDTDDDDNGVDLRTPARVRSEFVTLGDANFSDVEPTGEADQTPTVATDGRANMTVDFGFYEPLTLGSRVFIDERNQCYRISGERNGAPGFELRLFEDGNDDGQPDGAAIAITTTNQFGDYTFSGLRPGIYIAEVVPPAGSGYVSSSGRHGSKTEGLCESGGIDPDDGPGGGINNDDNGYIRADGRIFSKGIQLTSRGENVADSDPNPNTNRSLDFGFFRPLSLGNLVWDDLNDDGLRSANEPGIAGVQINLLHDSNNDGAISRDERANPVLTTTTDTNGMYLFSHLGAGNYQVVLNASNFVTGAPLHGMTSSDDISYGTIGPYEPAPDPDDLIGPKNNPIDNDDNGSAVDNAIESAIVTLRSDTEPVAESPNNDTGTRDTDNNLTVDFGVYRPYSIGNRVWLDANNNARQDPSEIGIGGVEVRLLLEDGSEAALVNTDANGYYRFDALREGTYKVEISAQNYIATGFGTAEGPGPLILLKNSEPTAADPNDDVDQDDNGIVGGSGAAIPSGAVRLGPDGGERIGETDIAPSGQGTADAFANMTVDFGFHGPRVHLGNKVWLDTNKDGRLGTGERGIAGVTLSLCLDSNNDGVYTANTDSCPSTTQTDASGHYTFTNLLDGGYFVRVDCENFKGAPLFGHNNSPGAAEGNSDEDGRDHGLPDGGCGYISSLISLKYGAEPMRMFDAGDANLTIDFGFFPSPTAVTLDDFAVSSEAGAAAILWRTSLEKNTLGFNLWRTPGADRAGAVKVNAKTIAATSAQGGSYRVSDPAGVPGSYYWLEEVELSGVSIWHGPAQFVAQAGPQIAVQVVPSIIEPSQPVTAVAVDQSYQNSITSAVNAEVAQQPAAPVAAAPQTNAPASAEAVQEVPTAPVGANTAVLPQSSPHDVVAAPVQQVNPTPEPARTETQTQPNAQLTGYLSAPLAERNLIAEARAEMLRTNMMVLFAGAAGFGFIAFAAFLAAAVLLVARRVRN